MPDLLANLNEPQLAAVTLPPDRHALILAGAGSGKTRVLTTRIAWLLSSQRASPSAILAVTFTNKAAREMSTRLAAMLPLDPRRIWIGTFHGLCNRLLRLHHRDAALPASFQILDSQDQQSAIKRLLKTLNVDDEKFPPRSLQHFINGAKEEGQRAGEMPAGDSHHRRCVELYQAYDDQCQREGVVDFAELLLRSYELLARNQPLREHYQQRFRQILVDEFQDTNNLQYKWLCLLAGGGASVFAVGDDDQSIYAFRGANVGNMAAFEREFHVSDLIRLEQNYRSHGRILECANALIGNNTRRLGKSLWTDAGEGEPVRVFEAMSDGQEAQWVIEEIAALVREGHLRSDVAVLYRSNAQSRVIEHALFAAGVSYRVYGGLRFFDRAEVKHALAYLRLLENPDDDGAFLRVVNFPVRGIGARSLEQLQDSARGQGTSLFGAVRAMSGAAAGKLAGFTALISSLAAGIGSLSLSQIIEQLLERSGLVVHYQATKEGQERVENLLELVNAAVSFMADAGVAQDTPGLAGAGPEEDGVQVSPLAAFLAHASLESGENQAGEGQDAVQLMTVHAAKGLEFDAVFITGLEEGLFPHENAASEPDGLEEERRLMYVAITRARERLYLSMSQTRMLHGQTRYSLKSRFIDELPETMLKWLTPKARPSGDGWPGERSSSWGGGRNGGFSERGGSAGYAGSGDGSATGGAQRADYGDTGRAAPQDRRVAQRFDRGIGYRIGQGVAHARFGEGVITEIEGDGADARVQVNFGRQGVKWLALSVAKLQAI